MSRGLTGILRNASFKSRLCRVVWWPRRSMIFMASSRVWYDSVRYCSGMPSLTEDPRGKERSWMQRHPANFPLCFLGTAPRGEQAFFHLFYYPCLWAVPARAI